MRPHVLVVEDDPERREVVRGVLAREYECRAVGTAEEAFAAIGQDAWAAAVVDYDLAQGGSGLEVLQALREASPGTLRVLYTVYYTDSLMRDIARLAHPHASVDARPVDFLNRLRRTVGDLLAVPEHGPAPVAADASGVWIGVAPASARFLAELHAAAESEAPVFLYGEPGAGSTQAAKLLRDRRAAWKRRTPGPAVAAAPAAVILRVPPLRERRQDIPHLAHHYVVEHARMADHPAPRLGADALAELARREWRGNLPELHGVIARACLHACAHGGARPELRATDLPHDHLPAWRPSQYAKDDGQRECVLRQLRAARNVSGASRLEGCSRANYIRMMRRLGVLRADVPADVALDSDDDV
jgi:DNA-binding NtrC family response regulator